MMKCLWIALALASSSACLVEETGYGDTDLPPANEMDPALDAAEDDNPDGAGAEASSGFLYTATGVLSEVPSPVTIIGLPGSVVTTTEISGRVAPAGTRVAANVAGTGFVLTIDAALGDTVQVLSEVDTVIGSVEINEDFASDAESAPLADADLSDVSVILDSDDDGTGAGGGNAAGAVQVGEGSFGWLVAPYLAYVPRTGAAELVEVGDTDVLLDASAGDELCLAGVDEVGKPGPATCIVL